MRKIAVLLIALTGTLVALRALEFSTLPLSVGLASMPLAEKIPAIALSLLPLGATLAVGIYLIVARERTAAWYVPDPDELPVIESRAVLRVGIVLLGLYLVAQALPQMVAHVSGPVVLWIQIQADAEYGSFASGGLGSWFFQSLPSMLSTAASLALGLWILAKREYLADRLTGEPSRTRRNPDGLSAECPNCGTPYDPRDYEGGVALPRCMNCKQPLEIPDVGRSAGSDEQAAAGDG